jgi:hypothetical protein
MYIYMLWTDCCQWPTCIFHDKLTYFIISLACESFNEKITHMESKPNVDLCELIFCGGLFTSNDITIRGEHSESVWSFEYDNLWWNLKKRRHGPLTIFSNHWIRLERMFTFCTVVYICTHTVICQFHLMLVRTSHTFYERQCTLYTLQLDKLELKFYLSWEWICLA